jgi:hypothetical protein
MGLARALRPPTEFMPERSWLEARRAAAQDSTRPTDRLALVSVLAGALLIALMLALWLRFSL